jgi:diguanylate cyclase (GGDEF)-like protein
MPPDSLQYQIYRAVAPLAIAILIVLLVASLGKRVQGRGIGRLFGLFVASIIGYLWTNYLEISSTSVENSLFWSKCIYLFIVFLPIIWLDFCHRMAFEGRGLPKIAVGLFLVFPIATLIVVFLPSLSVLMWSETRFFRQGDFFISVRRHGAWFTAYAIYTYSFFLGGAAAALGSFIHYRRFYNRQAAWVLGGIALPFGASLVYVLRPFPGLVKDFTPIGYAVGAMLFYIALFHRDLFSLAPVGRDQVIERLAEGILVLDTEGRLVDANPAAMRMLGLVEGSLGRPIADESASLGPEFGAALGAPGPSDLSVGAEETRRCYRVEPSSFQSGRIVVVTDQTELRALIARVEDLAMRDELTGLPNRRSFLAEGERELARARRRGLPLVAVMIDFDNFKAINDGLGHAAGDAVLRAFGAILSKEARAADVRGRIGGDEFAVLAACESGASSIRILCERLRSQLAAADIRDDSGASVRATISAGIAVRPPESTAALDRLLSDADAALYEAKHRGRDAIFVVESK